MRYVSYEQEMDERCYDPLQKGFKGHIPRKSDGDKFFDCREGWVTKSTSEFFVADIGDFTLNMQHSFMAPDIGKAGVSTDYRGFVAACPNNHPKTFAKCKRMAVPNTSGDVAPEDIAGTVKPDELGIDSLTGTESGEDEISVGDLLKLTPVAQDNGWHSDIPDLKLPKEFGHPDTSIREDGGMLMLAVSYDNTGYMRPGLPTPDMPSLGLGAIKPITYTYRPYFVPTKTNKRVEVIQASDASVKRTVNIWYGVTVQMSFEGKIVEFSWAQLLKGLTTGLVLLSSATTLVVYLAIYVFPHAEKYTLQMYQYTEDMSEYKKLDHSKLDVTSWTGKAYQDKRKEGKALSNEEITDILLDYEIRLNRVDGRDPKLAFITSDDPHPTVKDIREAHKKKSTDFFKSAAAMTGAE